MKLEQSRWTETGGLESNLPGALGDTAQLAFLFGSTAILRDKKYINEIKKVHPTKAYLDSWIAMILSLKNSISRNP